jgi:hypothetical protein
MIRSMSVGIQKATGGGSLDVTAQHYQRELAENTVVRQLQKTVAGRRGSLILVESLWDSRT